MLGTMLARAWRYAVLGLALGLGAPPAPVDAADRMSMSHAGAAIFRLPIYVAIQNGYFKDEGIDLQVVDTRSGSDAMKMLAGRSVDISTGQLIDSVLLAKQGIEVKGIALLSQRISNSVVVRKALAKEIRSIKDIKGRTFGVTGIGSGTWQLAVYLGVLEGLKAEDFNFIGVGSGASVIAALKAGRVDALSYADPENPQLVADGDAEFLVDLADDATHKRLIGDTYLNNQIMVLASYAKANPDRVQRFVNALQRANVWAQGRPVEEIAKVVHAYPGFAKIDYAQIVLSLKRMGADGIVSSAVIPKAAYENAIKLPLAIKAIDAHVPYETLVDTSFAEAAVKKHPSAR